MHLDLRDDVEVQAIVVVPLFGPDHLAGCDCWCGPQVEDGVIVHGVQH